MVCACVCMFYVASQTKRLYHATVIRKFQMYLKAPFASGSRGIIFRALACFTYVPI